MNFLDTANLFIPGYPLLSEAVRKQFEDSNAGFKFVGAIKETQEAIVAFRSSVSWWQLIFIGVEGELEKQKEKFKSDKVQLIAQIETSEEYKTVIAEIIRTLLPEICPDYEFLNPEDQFLLAKAPFSQALYALINCDQQIAQISEEFGVKDDWYRMQHLEDHRQELEELYQKKDMIIKDWQEQFANRDELSTLKVRIAEEKKKERDKEIKIRLVELADETQKLAEFFPLLKTDPLTLAEFQKQYFDALQNENADLLNVEENELAIFIFHHLQQATKSHFEYVELHSFNLKQAKLFAQRILIAFHQKKDLESDTWFAEYQKQLTQKLHAKLLLINNRESLPETPEKQELLGSLSSLFGLDKTVERTKEFLNKLADAHAFIQATGFSTQNESSFLAILDIYNYGRAADQITETKAILASLFRPFYPLYEEYRDIALYEKNVYLKIIRTVMPMLVVAGFVTLVAALLAPLLIPELAFSVVLIPTLFLGLAFATKYVTLKNDLYKLLRENYYGGVFEIPEFQTNIRMFTIFKNEGTALAVRNFYIQEIQRCDEIDAAYQAGAQEGTLSEEEIKLKKANLLKRHTLCLEWYDIHSNVALGCEKVPQLVIARLEEVKGREYTALREALQANFPELQKAVAKMVRELKTTFAQKESPVESIAPPRAAISGGINGNHSPRLFKPSKLLAHKLQAEKLDAIAATIRVC
ncbi:hypothetical protein [Legionella brunensis]|uniref:Uncharacterized protein n=1 Tax=Legionella brunensis TaxID=29422 RepID=A0A0W0SMB0_9GAMM|nr:hypothetical protein [Legionella brunensis]KTC84511.1 hypothetical protein Lbru_1379 [Legionella brunensis]